MCVCARARADLCVFCGVSEEYYVYIYTFFFRLMCLFLGLTDFVKRSFLILVDEIPRYRNYYYYYYTITTITTTTTFSSPMPHDIVKRSFASAHALLGKWCLLANRSLSERSRGRYCFSLRNNGQG